MRYPAWARSPCQHKWLLYCTGDEIAVFMCRYCGQQETVAPVWFPGVGRMTLKQAKAKAAEQAA